MQDFERRLNAEIVKRHLQGLQRAQNRKSSIPGPQEAKECMLTIEKAHMISRRSRLQVIPLTKRTLIIKHVDLCLAVYIFLDDINISADRSQ